MKTSQPSTQIGKRFNRKQLLLLSDICLIIVAALWGSSYGVAKLSLQFYPVLGFLAIRFGLTSLILLPVLIKTYFDNKAWLWHTVKIGVPLGSILFTIFLFETYGLFHTTASNAAFLISLCIIMTPFMEWLILKNRPHNLVFICAIISLLGTYLLTIDSTHTVGLSLIALNLGDGLILMAALCRAMMVTMTKKLTEQQPSIASVSKTLSPLPVPPVPSKASSEMSTLALTAVQTLVVFIGSLTLFLINNTLTGEEWHLPMLREFWLPTLYLVVFCTIFAFFIQNWAVKIGSPSRASLLMGSEPVFGALFAVLLFNEQVGALGWIGGGLITLASVILVLKQH